MIVFCVDPMFSKLDAVMQRFDGQQISIRSFPSQSVWKWSISSNNSAADPGRQPPELSSVCAGTAAERAAGGGAASSNDPPLMETNLPTAGSMFTRGELSQSLASGV